MPYYYPIKKLKDASLRKRTVEGLQRLRQQLIDERFPSKKSSESLILGTWNLRNFDDDRFNYGPRLYESFYFIAEIISHFDVIAIQEVCADLWPLQRIMNIIDKDYEYIVTDVTHSSLGGNQERLGFIYNKSKVTFNGVAGEIVLPQKMMISEVDTKKRQFSRTPFGVGFQSGWFKFFFSTVHIYFGSNSQSSAKYKRRVQEIEAVAKYIAKEAKNSDSNHILVGDFNIKKTRSPGFNALEKNGFTVVTNKMGSNRDQTKFYDQISFRSKKMELDFVEPERDDRVIQFFNSIFRDEDYETYKPIMKERIADKLKFAKKELAVATTKKDIKKYTGQIASLTAARKTNASLRHYYNEWRTFQASDHLPLWVEIKIDFSDQYLEQLKNMD
jgi:exonuclease III